MPENLEAAWDAQKNFCYSVPIKPADHCCLQHCAGEFCCLWSFVLFGTGGGCCFVENIPFLA